MLCKCAYTEVGLRICAYTEFLTVFVHIRTWAYMEVYFHKCEFTEVGFCICMLLYMRAFIKDVFCKCAYTKVFIYGSQLLCMCIYGNNLPYIHIYESWFMYMCAFVNAHIWKLASVYAHIQKSISINTHL